MSLDHIQYAIRENCGLFVVIQSSQVFLLHQTAREFLVRLPPTSSDVPSPSSKWQHSLGLKESHRLLSEICIRYLLFADFKRPVGERRPEQSNHRSGFVFLDYAASNWPDHYRQAHNTHGTNLEHLAWELCDTNSPACSYWLKVYGKTQMQNPEFFRELPTSLLITSYFGLDDLVNLILQDKKTTLDTTGARNQRTALSWASEKGYDSIVQSLLDRVPKHQVIFRNWLSSSSPTIVNQTDNLGKSPLWYSAANGHLNIVQCLLKRGAKVGSRDENGLTPLSWASYHGHSDIVALLLKNAARQDSKSHHLEMRDRYSQTPLLKAPKDGDDAIVKLLLDNGAKIDALDLYGKTALMNASENGYSAIVKLLLDGGAKVDDVNKYRWTALLYASKNGHSTTVKLLLDSGTEVNASNTSGWTALILASDQGHKATVELLLDSGAKINASDTSGLTALIWASRQGHKAIVELLLDSGATVSPGHF